MNRDYWKQYAWKLESDLRDADQNAFFWRWTALICAVTAFGLGVNLWLSI